MTTFTDDTTDFSVQVTETKNAGAELVFLPIYYTPSSMILTQAASMDYAPIFFGVDGMDGILTMEGFDTSLAEGVLLLTPFSADAKDEKTVNLVRHGRGEQDPHRRQDRKRRVRGHGITTARRPLPAPAAGRGLQANTAKVTNGSLTGRHARLPLITLSRFKRDEGCGRA